MEINTVGMEMGEGQKQFGTSEEYVIPIEHI